MNKKIVKYYILAILLFSLNTSYCQIKLLTYKGFEEFPIFNNYHLLYFADSTNNEYCILSKKHFNDLSSTNFDKLQLNKQYSIEIFQIDKNKLPELSMSFRNYGIENKLKKIIVENGKVLIDVYISSNLIDFYYIE